MKLYGSIIVLLGGGECFTNSFIILGGCGIATFESVLKDPQNCYLARSGSIISN